MDASPESLAALIAQRLNSLQVPCALWGHCLLNVHGVPSIIDSIDFLVPNHCLEVASKATAELDNLMACSDLQACRVTSPDRVSPPPSFHLHIKDDEITVGLYLQSETLWFLPPLSTPLSSDFLSASDQTILPSKRPGRGSGAFEPGQHDVMVPKAHILLEAFIRIYACDSGKRGGAFGMPMICYMEEYVDDDGFLDDSQLPELLRTFYSELRNGSKPVASWTRELKAALGVSA